jgi:hypothetical protein
VLLENELVLCIADGFPVTHVQAWWSRSRMEWMDWCCTSLSGTED